MGILSSIGPLVIFFIQPIWGFVADKFGRKWILFVAMAMSASCFMLFNSTQSFYTILGLTLTLAIFWGTQTPLIDILALDYVEENKLSYSEFRMWGAIGWSVGSWLLSFLVLDARFLLNFRMAATILYICCLILAFTKTANPVSKIEKVDYSIKNFKTTFSNKTLLFFLLIVFVHSTTATSIWNYEGLLLEELGATRQLMQITFGLQGIFEIPLFFYANRIIKRFSLEKTIIFAMLITSLRLFLYGSFTSPYAIMLFDITHGITWSLFWVCCVEYVNNKVVSQWRASGQSFLWAIYGGAGAIAGNMLTGFQLDWMPIQRIYLINSSILFLFTILLIPVLLRKNQTIHKT